MGISKDTNRIAIALNRKKSTTKAFKAFARIMDSYSQMERDIVCMTRENKALQVKLSAMNSKSELSMTASELKEKYDSINPSDYQWSVHPDWAADDWAEEVYEGNTLQGYWDWVVSRIEEAAEKEE